MMLSLTLGPGPPNRPAFPKFELNRPWPYGVWLERPRIGAKEHSFRALVGQVLELFSLEGPESKALTVFEIYVP